MKPDLNQARAARASARDALTAAAATLERAKRIAASAADHVQTLEQRAAQSESAQAAQLADLIAAGGPTPELPTTSDTSLASTLASARMDLSIKSKALKSLQTAHATAQANAATAEAAVVNAVDAIFAAEDAELNRQVVHHLDEALRLGKQLFGRAVTNEMHRHGQLFTETLQRLDCAILDRRHLAINFAKEGDTVAAAQRAARRAALISGETAEEAAA